MMESKDKTHCDIYNLAEDKLKSFTRSGIRTKVMLCLLEGDMSSSDLGEVLGSRASTILHTIKDMTEENLVAKTPRGHALTNVGRIQALILEELVSTIIVLDQHKDFWLTHDLSGIPVELQMKIGMLAQSERVSSDITPLKSLENFMSELSRSKEIHGVSSFIAPEFPEMISDCVKRGTKVELILTDKILEIISKEHNKILNNLQRYDNFKMYHMDLKINIGFTVTESILALGLYRTDGIIDLGSELVCVGEKAIAWGEELFGHYKARSELINI